MKPEYATEYDFAKWTAQAEHMTAAELHYVILDCYAAAKAMDTWNPIKAGYYADQAMTFSMERMKR